MKVQLPGSGHQSQTPSGAIPSSLSQLSAQADLFSDLITSMLSVSAIQMNLVSESVSNDGLKPVEGENHTQEKSDTSDSHPGNLLSELLSSLMVISVAPAQVSPIPSDLAQQAQSNGESPTPQTVLKREAGLSSSLPGPVQNTMAEAQEQKTMDASGSDLLPPQINNILTQIKSKQIISLKIVNEDAPDTDNIHNEPSATVWDEGTQTVTPKVIPSVELQSKTAKESLHQRLPIEPASSLATDSNSDFDETSALKPATGTGRVMASRQSDEAGDTALYSREHTPSLNFTETNNKFTDAMVQMGHIVQKQVTQALSQDSQVSQDSRLAQSRSVDTQSLIQDMQGEESGLQIELLPVSARLPGEESYSAHIKIHPPELGSVLAKLKIDKNGTQLVIIAENHRVKEIVESNLYQLRENFQKIDIQITDVQVDVQSSSHGTYEQNSEQKKSSDSFMSDEERGQTDKQMTETRTPSKKVTSLVDTYA